MFKFVLKRKRKRDTGTMYVEPDFIGRQTLDVVSNF